MQRRYPTWWLQKCHKSAKNWCMDRKLFIVACFILIWFPRIFFHMSKLLQVSDFDLNQLKLDLDTFKNEAGTSVIERRPNEAPQHLPKRDGDRKCVVCPKVVCRRLYVVCRKQYAHRHKWKLINPTKRNHIDDPDYNKLISKFKLLFPDRNKTPKKACEMCGKLIAGRGAQMKKRQRNSGCKPLNDSHILPVMINGKCIFSRSHLWKLYSATLQKYSVSQSLWNLQSCPSGCLKIYFEPNLLWFVHSTIKNLQRRKHFQHQQNPIVRNM